MHFSIFGQDSLNGKVVNEKGTKWCEISKVYQYAKSICKIKYRIMFDILKYRIMFDI